MVRAARATGRERRSRAVRPAPDSAPRGHRTRPAAMSDADPGRRTSRWYHDPVRPLDERVVRFSRGSGDSTDGQPSEGDRRTSCRRRTCPPSSRARSTSAGWRPTSSRPTAPARAPTRTCEPFVIIQPPPNITGALHLGHALDLDARGRDDPARPDAGPPDALAARPRPRLDRRAVRARQDHRRRGRDAGDARAASATSSGCGSSSTRRARSCSASSAGSARRSTGAACGSRWTRAPRGPSASSFKRLYDDGLAYRTEALINWCPGCRTSVSDLEVHPDRRDGHALDDPLPPDRRGDRRARSRTPRSPSRRRGRRRSSATPPSPSTRTTSATAALVGRRVRIPFVERDVPIIADEVVDRAFGTGAVKITPAHDRDDYATGRSATTCR